MKKLAINGVIENGECESIHWFRNGTTYLAQMLEGKLVFYLVAVEDLVLKLEQKRLDLKPPELGLKK